MNSSRDFEWDYAVAITPDDSNDLSKPYPIGLHVTDDTSGKAVKVTFARPKDDGDGTESDVSATLEILRGDFVKMKVKRVFATGTEADTILGLYRRGGAL